MQIGNEAMARAVHYVFAFCFFPDLYLRALVWFGLLRFRLFGWAVFFAALFNVGPCRPPAAQRPDHCDQGRRAEVRLPTKSPKYPSTPSTSCAGAARSANPRPPSVSAAGCPARIHCVHMYACTTPSVGYA